jgi:hypothetical protein
MAYDRYDRDENSRWSDDRSDRNWRGSNNRGGRDERGFWDRASDEVASWFGDEEAERRRRQDQGHDERDRGGRPSEHSAFGRGWGSDRDYDRGYGRDYDRDRASYNRDQSSYGGSRTDRDFNYDRGVFNRGGTSDRDYNRGWRGELWGNERGSEGNRDWDRTHSEDRSWDRNRSSNEDRDWGRNRSSSEGRDWESSRRSNQGRDWDRNRSWNEDRGGQNYRPMTGDYGRSDHESEQFFAASGYGRGERALGDYDRSQTPYGRDEYRGTSFAGSRKEDRDFDPHYRSWRERHMSDLDRDYDDYRRENQSRFENDFTSWREKRQHKRGLLGQIREHMEVLGSDHKHVGTVDRTAGDRLILAKSDPDSGGVHHSLSCSDIDRVEGDKIILDCSAEEAKDRWRDESRGRALFEREDQGEMGPRNLNRSFEGTYR